LKVERNEMQVVNSLAETNWRCFLNEHQASNVFHTPEMFEVFARAKGHRPTLWGVINADGQVLSLLSLVQITLKGGLLRWLTTRAVAYGSLLYAPGLEGAEALALLLRTYVREVDGAPIFTELRNLSDLETAQPILREHGFVYEDHLNYLIDLDHPVEAIMQDIGKRTRKKIRKGLRRTELVIEEVTRREELSQWYAVLQQTYKHSQVPLADQSLFEAVFDVLFPCGMVKFLAARVGQAYAAVSAELIYRDVIYGWYGGTDRAYSQFYPNELLTWHILQWGAENGYKTYDFGGAGKPDEEYGVRDFKAKFGGDLVSFGRNTCLHSPLAFRLSKLGYQIYRSLLR